VLIKHWIKDSPRLGVILRRAFRKIRVVVGNRHTKEIVYSPPAPKEVRPLIDGLILWLNSDAARQMHLVLVAGIAHYELVRIHPFVDGNGRTARALATLILTMREFDIKRFFTLDDFYDSDRPAYYAVLKRTNGTYPDCTPWLDYFLEGVEISLARVKERVLLLSSDEHRKVAGGQVALSERQMKIIEFIHAHGSVKTSDLASMFRVSRQAALRELTAMAGKDLPAIALASVEAYRLIEGATDPAQRPAPIELAMLDYSGFKLSILAAGPTADWAAIGATAKDSDSNWSALAKNVRDSGIHDLAAAIQDGLRSAVARKDIEGVKFAAKLQLGIVDVLEGYFKRAKSR